ncbi:MAG: ImmA/IrrE family metallo-endopeptidase [Fibrobacterota bacterium]|nr:MAG: ImmA/IrrE family metallo-endopeptidase [Fibrobacterota bacterium]
MNSSTPAEIFGARLRQARVMRGLSLRALADKLHGLVSHTTVDQLEEGTRIPGSEVLLALAECLGQDLDFFFRPISVRLDGIDFRKKAKLGQKDIARVREEASAHFERYLELEELCGERMEFQNPLSHPEVIDEGGIDHVALLVRSKWKLGHDPIPNVLELLEQHGVKVHLLEGPDDFYGFSGWSGTIPVVVINQRQPPDRIRFTALHELGHLILDLGPTMNEEKACHRFAGAFLLPAEACRTELRSKRTHLSVPELLSLKRRWGMSMAAIGKRAQQVEILSDAAYTSFAKEMSRRGWRRTEPGEVVAETICRFDRLLFRALVEDYISLSKASELSGIPMDQLRNRLQGAE